MNRVFVDMDGVTVDFEAYMAEHGITGDEAKRRPRAYLEMKPRPGAIEAIRSLIGMGYQPFMATKPPTGISFAYADKAQWVLDHLPELRRHIIITHDKGLLGGSGDFLVDDRPHKANCEAFAGTLLPFGPGRRYEDWPQILEFFRRIQETRAGNRRFSHPTLSVPSPAHAPPIPKSLGPSLTTDHDDPRLNQAKGPGQQNEVYFTLSPEEISKGLVRPYRDSYKHVGIRPVNPTRPLTEAEKTTYGDMYVAYEEYPKTPWVVNQSSAVGRFWTKDQLNSGCNTTTTMGQMLSFSYARDPKTYGRTWCCQCCAHHPVEEFTWTADGQRVGS